MTRRATKRLILLLAGLAVVALLAVGGLTLRKQAKDRALIASREAGIRLADSGEYAEGLEVLGPYVARFRGDEEAVLAYARCRLGVPLPNGKHLIGAIAAGRLAAEQNPGSLAPLDFLIGIYAETGQLNELVDACERALALDPDHEAALDARVYALAGLDRIPEARAAADEFAERHPRALRALIATTAVMRAEGATATEIDAFVRTDGVADRLGDQTVYHLFAAASAAEAGEAGDADGFVRAVASAERAAAMTPESPLVAAESTALLRRLAQRTGNDGLRALAEETVDRRLGEGGLGDAYAAIESRAAWWALDTGRARELARRIEPSIETVIGAGTDPEIDSENAPEAEPASDPVAAIGWRLFLLGEGEPAEAETSHGEYRFGDSASGEFWSRVVAARAVAVSGGSPSAVDAALDTAAELAVRLDAREVRTRHAALVALVRAEALAASGQVETALDILDRERARLMDGDQVVPNRLLLGIADLRAARGEFEEASRLIEAVEAAGPAIAGSPEFRAVVNRYLERRLGDTATAASAGEAAGQLDRVAAMAADRPEDAMLAAAHARLLMLAGRTVEGLAKARRLLELGPPAAEADLAELSRLVAMRDTDLAGELLGLADAGTGSAAMIEARAQLAAMRGDPSSGLAIYGDAIRALGDGDRVERVRILRAGYIERHFGALGGALGDIAGDPAEVWAALSADYPSSAVVQTAALDSRAVWDDEPTVRAAVARLRDATGEDALEWRIASLRADLTFLHGDDEARAAALSKIILNLRAVQERADDNAAVSRLIGIAYDRAGQTGEAARALRSAASQDPVYYPELVKYLLDAGMLDDAARALDGFEAEPRERLTAETIRERASLLQAMGRAEAALTDRRVLARGGRLEDVADLGLLLARLGQADEAGGVAESLVGPGRPMSAVSAGTVILLELGRVEEAVGAYLARAEPDAAMGEARVGLARLLAGVERWDEAAEQVRLAMDEGGLADAQAAVMLRTHALVEAGRWREAGALFADAAERDGASGEIGSTRTVRALAAGLERAGVGAAGGGEADGVAASLVRALAAIRVGGDADGAASAIEGYLLGETTLGALRGELDALVSASADDAGARSDPRVWQALVLVEGGLIGGNPMSAGEGGADGESSGSALIETLGRAADALPRAAWPLRRQAELLLGMGRLDEAEGAATRLAQRLGGDPFAADTLRARIAWARGRGDTALNWLLPHRDRLARGDGAHADRGVLIAGFVMAGRAGEADAVLGSMEGTPGRGLLAIEGASRLPGAETDRRRAWVGIADAEYERDSGERGPLAVDRVALGRAWAALARASGSRDDATRARSLLAGGDSGEAERAGDPIGVGMDLASAELILGEREAAASRYARLVEAYPSSVMLRNNYAAVLVEELGRPGDGEAEAAEALRLARDQGLPPGAIGVISHTLGMAQRGAGRLGAAAETLEAGIAAAGPTPDLVIELAEVLAALDRRGDALEVLDRYPLRGGLTERQRARVEAVRLGAGGD